MKYFLCCAIELNEIKKGKNAYYVAKKEETSSLTFFERIALAIKGSRLIAALDASAPGSNWRRGNCLRIKPPRLSSDSLPSHKVGRITFILI